MVTWSKPKILERVGGNKRLIMMKAKTQIWILLIISFTALFIAGCEKEEPEPPDFGMEEGYYLWINDDEKEWYKRDRNHLSIRFYVEHGREFHDSVLKSYGIETVHAHQFNDDYHSTPGKYRVTEKPAENYYTTYGDTTLNRLGNMPQVRFVLPIFHRVDEHEQFPELGRRRLTPEFFYRFHDHISNNRQEEILDSLKMADNIKIIERDYVERLVYVTKASPADPYTLHHRYYDTDFFKYTNLNTSVIGIRLTQK